MVYRHSLYSSYYCNFSRSFQVFPNKKLKKKKNKLEEVWRQSIEWEGSLDYISLDKYFLHVYYVM